MEEELVLFLSQIAKVKKEQEIAKKICFFGIQNAKQDFTMLVVVFALLIAQVDGLTLVSHAQKKLPQEVLDHWPNAMMMKKSNFYCATNIALLVLNPQDHFAGVAALLDQMSAVLLAYFLGLVFPNWVTKFQKFMD